MSPQDRCKGDALPPVPATVAHLIADAAARAPRAEAIVFGEVIRAFVVLRAGARTTADDPVAHCRANLAPYKVPASIECLSALPKTTVNQTDRQKLQARAAG
ncbi:MAG TPA: hypothetical protein VLD36_13170 [Burkholderiales bacterium]|nr:hypothetical protein [Burkholderiales bacterium]